MKIYFYSLLLLFLTDLCLAQGVTLSQAEYYWDTDPGEGNGIALPAVDGNFSSSFEPLALTGMGAPSTGLHKFCVRVKDATGVWSPVFTQVVVVEATPTPTAVQLTLAEYFWDADPGEGSATPLLPIDGSFDRAFEKVAVAGLNAPSTGLHTFSSRVKDNQGVWSPVFTQVIVVEATTTPTTVQLTQAEYFWDTDPGEGSGTPFLATDGNFDRAFEQLQQTAIPIVNPVGLHTFNVRVKDNAGVWGPVFKQAIFIETVLSTTTFAQSKLLVYPNPVKDVLHLSFEGTLTSVRVYNSLGQEVVAQTIAANEGVLDVANLVAGTYIVTVQTEQGMKAVKIIKE